MKKIILVVFCFLLTVYSFSQEKKSKEEKRKEREERINQLIKEEEAGALIFSKQGAFGIKLNTDGYGIFYEHGKYKTISLTNIWWAELGERKHDKEERFSITDPTGYYTIGNPYIFGKINNFYYLKLGIGQQRLIGGKGNKNGVAVSAIYGGGFSLGSLKPYYLTVTDSTFSSERDIKYSPENDSIFRDPTLILGSAGFTKGFGDMKLRPGLHARAALRFDYGMYNELLSAIEVGVNAEFYFKDMQIMIDDPGKKFFLNAYIAIEFGKRKMN